MLIAMIVTWQRPAESAVFASRREEAYSRNTMSPPRSDSRPSIRKDSAKAELQRKIAIELANAPLSSAWQKGIFNPDIASLGKILRITDPKNTTGASVPAAVD